MHFSSAPVGLQQPHGSRPPAPIGRGRSSLGDAHGDHQAQPQAKPQRGYLVYKATAPNRKVYVGITSVGLSRRRELHYRHSRSPSARAYNTHMGRALRKYGGSFVWEILEDGIPSQEAAWEKERYFIAKFRSNDPKVGYNGTKGGEGCSPTPKTEEHKRKIKLGNAHPLLRSDGVAFLSGPDADVALGLIGKGDYATKSMRRGGLCCGFTFTRIPLDEYLSLEAAGQAWDGTTPSEPHPMAHKGWAWSEDQRAMLMASRQRPHSERHERNRIAAISKSVHCSDGRLFHSIGEAATEFGMTTDQVSYACRKGRLLNGQILSYDPVLDGAVVASRMRVRNSPTLPKSLCRSDGKVFQTMGAAARELDVSASTMTYALKHSTPVKGFRFTRTESPIGKEL